MRSDDRQPFDIEAHEAADITQQFWGTSRGWDPLDQLPADDEGGSERRTGSIRALSAGLAAIRPRRPQQSRRADVTGRIDRTRSHGIPRPKPPALAAPPISPEATLGELAAGWIDDDDWPELDDLCALPPTRQSARIERQRDRHRSDEPTPATEYAEDEFDEDADFDNIEADAARLVPLTHNQTLSSRLGLGAVDPLLARLGAIVLIGVLLVPLALSSRGGASDVVAGDLVPLPVAQASSAAATVANSAAATVASTGATPSTSDDPPATTAGQASVVTQVETAAPSASDDVAPLAAAATDTGDEAAPESATLAATPAIEAATVSEEADRLEPECVLTYTAGAGDSWYRIADAAGVSPGALMDANLAGLETPIFPGDEICLPEGATIPEQLTTTTAPPASTTAAPTTTAPPATTTPPPAPASTSRVQELIREIWPDDLEDKALQIAWRESNYRADAYNGSCCYGVFQLHWASHKSWLDDYGITSTNDLFDARKNITAAYALYQRSGGWGPWGG